MQALAACCWRCRTLGAGQLLSFSSIWLYGHLRVPYEKEHSSEGLSLGRALASVQAWMPLPVGLLAQGRKTPTAHR